MNWKNTDKPNKQADLLAHPTRFMVILFIAVWAVGNGLLVLTMTDFFTESMIDKKNYALYMLMFSSTWAVGSVVKNYLRNTNKSK